ncbi:hypothetical protein I2484_10040, partial [Sporosarcina sp. E16_8]|nr:hypothetical protein [Sporosarcina sp. E16_8]
IGSISLNNIDKTAPDISLTASPTTLTATDVTISAYIRDLEKGNFKTPESTSITQTHTFTIPGLKKLNKASVSTGNVEVVNVDGDKVTVNVSGGARTRQEQTGGEYTPADTQYVTEQTAANYDVGGYKGTLTQYVASGEYLSEDTKYIPDHPTPTFDVGGYKGNLTKYLYSGKLTPGSEKSINSFLTPFYSDAQGYSGWLSEWVYYYPFFMTIEEYNSGVKFPNSISMDTILDYAYANEKCSNSNNPLRGIQATKWAGGSPTVYTPGYNWGNSCGGIAYEYFFTNGGHFSTGRTVMSQTYQYSLYSGTVRQPDTDTRIYKYRGDVTRPVTDTRVYKYQGNVTKPAVDTRTYDDLYQYEITLDFEKVVPVQKWAKGEQSKDYFKSNGKSFFESAFKVSENAIYTVYASDVAGNDAVETITIKNIDDIPPTIKLTANPTTPTNQDVTITAEIEDSSDIQVKKWMSGYQNISFFNEGGNEFLDSSFKVSVNGVYTVYAKDEAGNESIQTITITNIDRIPPATPILSASTSGPTNGNVFVTITYPSDASVKHYRINGGAWTLYTSAVPMTDKGIVEARGQDTAGNWSEIGSITISNIDTNAPVIKLTADPTTPTNQDVTIAADIKDNEKRKVNTSESIVSTQIETFTIPGLKKLNGAKADTGNVEIVSVDGEKVTVKTSGGNPSGQKQTGGSYIPEETKFVTGQPSSSYNVDGYKGNLQMYLYSTNNIPGPSKVLVNQYYGEGWATALYTNTTWEPMRITSITQHFSQGPTPYSDAEGYTGTVQITAYPGGDNCYSHNYGVNMQCSIAYSLYASGTVSKPGTVSNVYRYKGNVTKPAEDTRTYTDTYKYEVTFDYEANVPVQKWAKGNQSVEFFKNGGTDLLVPNFKVSENDTYTVYAQDLGGNETVETINIGNIDKIPPTIVLSQTPERPVNVDITIRADITDNVEIAEKKYAAGTRNAEYFATAGEILPGNKFIVTDNGAYTVYARDTAGNETVETITISNIDRVAPGKATFSINPSTPTNQDVLVTIFYPSDAFEKEYKIGENGAWRLYREPVKLVNNNTVFARSKDRAENMSEESSIEVTNIDKTPPTIVLTDAATESHVVITADINDVGSGIDVKKYAAGRRAASYFETEGTILSGNIFNVTENGTYTVYAKDKAGNETVRTIAVIKMPITSPNPNPKPDPIPNPNPGTCVSGPNGNASGGGLSFTGCSPEKINTVTVHTPVVMYARASDDKEHDQRTNPPERSTPANPNKDRHAFILDRPFTVKLPTSGQHLDDGLAPGYGERDFLKYVEEKEVKFPFDVYTETKEGFYPKGTWIKIPKSIEASTFYLPVWVPEGPYTVEYRSIAINAPGAKPQDVPKNNLSEGMQEHHANLNLDYRTPDEVMQHHIAYDTIEVDVVGRLYDFRVTDILDYQWGSVFRKQEGLIEHTGNNYWVGKNAIDGGLRGNEDPFALPIRQGSHPEGYKNVAVKTGYQFKFDMKTKGNMWNVDDAIRITPSFYFVNKDGTGRRPVDIYYHTDAKYFTKIGSEKDLEYREVKLNEPLRNVEQKQLYDTSKFTYRNPDEYGFRSIVDESLESTFIRNFERDYSKRATKTGPYGNQILNWNLRTLIGPDENQVPSGSMVSPKDAKAREQQWYGEYSLPADIYVVDPLLHPDIAGYGVEHRLTKKSPIFLQDGYVIVNFNIETIDNKNTEKPHLQYHKGPLANQWKMEGFKYNFIDPYDRDFKLIDGDVIFYHGDQSSYDDYKSSVTH